jgi:hypothetical protein
MKKELNIIQNLLHENQTEYEQPHNTHADHGGHAAAAHEGHGGHGPNEL